MTNPEMSAKTMRVPTLNAIPLDFRTVSTVSSVNFSGSQARTPLMAPLTALTTCAVEWDAISFHQEGADFIR